MFLRSLFNIGLFASGIVLGLQVPHPTYAPTEREMIDILVDYDVRHMDAPIGVPYYGATDMDHHIIYLMNNSDLTFKRRTVIHELAHIIKRMRSEPDTNEDELAVIEELEYKRIFVDGK